MSDIVCLSFVMNFSGSRYMVPGSLLVTDPATMHSLAFRFYLFELSCRQSVHIIYFRIALFSRPKHSRWLKCSWVCIRSVVNLNWFEEVRYTSEHELPVICRIAEQKLSCEVHSLKLPLDYGAHTTDAVLGSWKCNVWTYFLVKIQSSVVTYHPGQCIYSKHMVDTFLQRIGWHGAWQLWHLCGGLHIPIKHRFRYRLMPTGMSRPCT